MHHLTGFSWLCSESSGIEKYAILLFGPAASLIESDRVVIEISDACTCDELKSKIVAQHPTLSTLIGDLRKLATSMAAGLEHVAMLGTPTICFVRLIC